MSVLFCLLFVSSSLANHYGNNNGCSQEGDLTSCSGCSFWRYGCDNTVSCSSSGDCGNQCADDTNCYHWTSNGGSCCLNYNVSSLEAYSHGGYNCGWMNRPNSNPSNPSTEPPQSSGNNYELRMENNCPYSLTIGAQNIPNWPWINGYTLGIGESTGCNINLNNGDNWPTSGYVWGCDMNKGHCNGTNVQAPCSRISINKQGNVIYGCDYVMGYNIPIGVSSNGCPSSSCPSMDYGDIPNEIIWMSNGQQAGCYSLCEATRDSTQSQWFRHHWGANFDNMSALVCCEVPHHCNPSEWPLSSDGSNYATCMSNSCNHACTYPYDTSGFQTCNQNPYALTVGFC